MQIHSISISSSTKFTETLTQNQKKILTRKMSNYCIKIASKHTIAILYNIYHRIRSYDGNVNLMHKGCIETYPGSLKREFEHKFGSFCFTSIHGFSGSIHYNDRLLVLCISHYYTENRWRLGGTHDPHYII